MILVMAYLLLLLFLAVVVGFWRINRRLNRIETKVIKKYHPVVKGEKNE